MAGDGSPYCNLYCLHPVVSHNAFFFCGGGDVNTSNLQTLCDMRDFLISLYYFKNPLISISCYNICWMDKYIMPPAYFGHCKCSVQNEVEVLVTVILIFQLTLIRSRMKWVSLRVQFHIQCMRSRCILFMYNLYKGYCQGRIMFSSSSLDSCSTELDEPEFLHHV